MPIPKPRKDEQKRDFIARCMESLANEFPKQPQRYAVCVGAWNDRNKEAPTTQNKS